ncbi:MAG: recombinase RecA [Puniceicoccales bacterium]|jgi:recombination protein RecA|nr:recombinase RecA [Puniceicoccales bacterium]
MTRRESGANGEEIAKVLAEINRRYGEGSLMRLGDAVHMKIDVISTGSSIIDATLGVGGLPRGRICEIFGPESSGKTTFCLSCIASTQRSGGTAAFIDVEHALDPIYARTVGVNLKDLLIAQPESGEMALRIAENLLQSGSIDMVVVDSVAALTSRAELDGQLGDPVVGAQARLMGQAMRRLTAATSKNGAVCLFTNQIRMKIGTAYGNPETTPGGNSLKFAASLRMDIRRIGQIKDSDGHAIGARTRLKVVKNKVSSPFTECEFDILFAEGISQLGSLLESGLASSILQQKGPWIYFGERTLGQGRQAAKDFLSANGEVAAKLEAAIRAVANGQAAQ